MMNFKDNKVTKTVMKRITVMTNSINNELSRGLKQTLILRSIPGKPIILETGVTSNVLTENSEPSDLGL